MPALAGTLSVRTQRLVLCVSEIHSRELHVPEEIRPLRIGAPGRTRLRSHNP